MNSNHAEVCGSPEWAEHLQQDVLPWVTRDVSLGEEMLEIGPGPGAATGWLRDRVRRLTAVEIEPEAAAALAARFPAVEVITGDATRLDYPDASFDWVGCFTMLHHVPTAALQDQILAGALRVLRPGGALVGSDSLASVRLHHFHEGDPYNPVEPAWLLGRLRTLGFGHVTVAVDEVVKFVAIKPAAGDGAGPGG